MADVEFVTAGYTLTGVVLAGYVGYLLMRARRARVRAAAIAARRGARAEP